ncbi:MAG: VanW family protein [Candidatus Doudnabacteria bacterium]|nr:VanW family protein [Candidatus Doudnabacteria bacterium]
MANIKKYLLLIIVAGFSFAAPKPVWAFAFAYQNSLMEVEPEAFDLWKGTGSIFKHSQLEASANVKSALLAYLGMNVKPEAETKIFKYRPDKIYEFVKTLSQKINVAKTEPVLEIKDGVAINFLPPSDGLTVDVYGSTIKALDALEKKLSQSDLLAQIDKPTKSLMETNGLGINELIALGESSFAGSPKNRIHNVKVGTGKFKGVIIKPGEEFSFNKFLGPVEEEQGFLPELVIKRTGTVPELGGGLCQVSSTTFRAAMNAGLPITQRKNHAYAVQYYSPQGTDATIYPGIVDLKFINNTPGHILIWPYIKDKYKLAFEFYGTKDSRRVTLEKPIQYDRKPDGSMKAEWTRVIQKDGQTSTSTFKSIYLSPALFHKEEAFPTSTSITAVHMPKTN